MPYKSQVNDGVKHACGHDAHTAIVLGAAEVLAGLKARLPGTVVFLFQPAEEGPPEGEEGGAPLMVKEGVLDDAEGRGDLRAARRTRAGPSGEVGWTDRPDLRLVGHLRDRGAPGKTATARSRTPASTRSRSRRRSCRRCSSIVSRQIDAQRAAAC